MSIATEPAIPTRPPIPTTPATSRARRVARNLWLGMALVWAASPRSLLRFSALGILNSAMPPISVYLGATLVKLLLRFYDVDRGSVKLGGVDLRQLDRDVLRANGRYAQLFELQAAGYR